MICAHDRDPAVCTDCGPTCPCLPCRRVREQQAVEVQVLLEGLRRWPLPCDLPPNSARPVAAAPNPGNHMRDACPCGAIRPEGA